MPDLPIAHPATGPPEGSGPQAQPGVGRRLGQPSLVLHQPVVGAFAWDLGLFSSDFGVGTSPAAHNAVGLAGESPVVGIDCLPT